MKRIDANARTIRELLDGAKFSIDSYQREYAWKERQVQELIDDLTGKFLGCYDQNHSRHEIAKYEHYFLGPVIISNKGGQRYIVDGQQRLTSLTLLLIFLHHRQKIEAEPTPILNLIHSMKFGQKSFNIDVPERVEVAKALLEGQPPKLDDASESVRNIADRYQTILDHFPEEIEGQAVVYFVDWLLENVYLVEIEAFSDEDAYTIFETMNDRGLPLSLPEMLKGYILARITHWVDTRCGLNSYFEDLISQGRGRPFEIEHIWANHPEDFSAHYKHPSDYEEARNRLGGLLLLQRGLNQSLGDATYAAKRDAYLGHSQNLLARSLHPGAYRNNPAFKKLIADTGLGFRDYESFGPDEQAERQELYLRLAEWVWNPSRLDLDGEKPPVPDEVPDTLDEEASANGNSHAPGKRGRIQKRFFEKLLAHSAENDGMHGHLSASPTNWAGTRRHKQWWNFVVATDTTRVELYLDCGKKEANKELFDQLAAHRPEIEAAFGGPLLWQRLDDKRASRISLSVPGGWADEASWPVAIETAVGAMKRLYAATGERVKDFLEGY